MSKSKKLLTINAVIFAFIVIALGVLLIDRLNKEYFRQVEPPAKVALSIAAPSGAPALPLAALIADEKYALDYDIADGPDLLTAEFKAAAKDFIIAPINVGVKLMRKGAPYKLLAIVSWGNLYVVADHSPSKQFYAFAQDGVPGILLKEFAGYFGRLTYHYCNSASEVYAFLTNGQAHKALLPEPLVTALLATHKFRVIESFRELYKKEFNVDNYPQAALFIADETLAKRETEVMNFTADFALAISNLHANPAVINDIADKVDLQTFNLPQKELLIKAMPKLALDFTYANDCVPEINAFLKLFELSIDDKSYVK